MAAEASSSSSFPGTRRHTIVYDQNLLGGPVVRKGGYLIKQGYERKSWRRRFFTLAGHNLHYFRDDNMTEKLGMIPLAGCKIVLQPNLRQNCFSISNLHRRTYYLSADTEHQMEDWIHDILEVINEIGDEDTLKNLQTYDLPEFEDLLLSKTDDFPEIAELIKKQFSPTKCIRISIIRGEELGLRQDLLSTRVYCKMEVTFKQSSSNPGTLEMISPSVEASNTPNLQAEFYFPLQQLKEDISKIRISLFCAARNRTRKFVEFRGPDAPTPADEDIFLGEIWLDPAKIIKAEKKSSNNRWILKVPSSFRASSSVSSSHGVIYTAFSWSFLTPQDMYRLGKEKIAMQHFATAKQLFQLGADARYSPAVSALAWWYCHGYGLHSEISLGFELYQKAAAQGDKVAQNNVGYCYQYGIGVSLDLQRARHWYTRAIEQSQFIPSFVNLGLMLLDHEGEGNPVEIEKARGLFLEAARRGSPEGQNNLAYCFQMGVGGPANSKEAFELFSKAAKAGYPPAQHNLGQCYELGIGVEKSEADAFHWYSLAGKQNHSGGLLALGLCYENGVGCEKDVSLAKKFYAQALGCQDLPSNQNSEGADYVF